MNELHFENKIPILMPIYNRPIYLIETINALKKCEGLSDFFIITFEEPNEDCSEIIDEINFIQVIRNKNKEKLGCNKNFSQLFKTAFKYKKFIVLEDDIIPQKDFLNYFKWAFNKFESESNIKTILAYNKSNGNPEKVFLGNYFCPWGWGGWSERINKIIEYEFEDDIVSWDSLLDQCFRYNNYTSVSPEISRVQNVGEIGTYTPSKDFHKENHYTAYTFDKLGILPIKEFYLH